MNSSVTGATRKEVLEALASGAPGPRNNSQKGVMRNMLRRGVIRMAAHALIQPWRLLRLIVTWDAYVTHPPCKGVLRSCYGRNVGLHAIDVAPGSPRHGRPAEAYDSEKVKRTYRTRSPGRTGGTGRTDALRHLRGGVNRLDSRPSMHRHRFIG
jgi:hypothetical protein